MSFEEECYKIVKKIPKGKVTTYKEIALKLNSRAYRAVGNCMNKNRNKKIPCHRVIKNNGEVGGFVFGTKKKIKILIKEGVGVVNGKINLKKFLYKIR